MINDSDYLDLTVQVVRSFVGLGRPHMTAAALGETLRRAVSDQSWRDLGYRTLGDLLRSPKLESRLEIFKTEKNALAVRLKAQASVAHTMPRKQYNRIAKPVWGAFVIANPPGKRFLNRKTGAVRSGIQEPPSPLDEWVEIPLIPVSDQKAWVDEFLQQQHLRRSEGIENALAATSWNYALSHTLGEHAGAWNLFRSSKVAASVDTWASSSGISHDLVFESSPTKPAPPAPVQGALPDTADNDRAVILAALATLPIERLREIALPAGALLTALRSR